MLFNIFSTIIIGFALVATQARRPIYAILALIVTFVMVAYTLLWLRKDFLALAFIIVYVGAVATLFLFIVMMVEFRDLPSGKEEVSEFPELEASNFLAHGLTNAGISLVYYVNKGWRGMWLALKTMSFVLFFCFVFPLFGLFVYNYSGNTHYADGLAELFSQYSLNILENAAFYENDLLIQGSLMYTQHFVQFMVIGLILFTAMLGAIALVVPSSVMKRAGY